MTDSTRALRRAIERWTSARGVSARRFGLAAVGDPSFVSGLSRGRVPRVGTADRALSHMGLAPLGPGFRREVAAFLAVTRTKASVFGLEAAGDTAFAGRLRKGASPRLSTVDRVRAWMARNASAGQREAIRRAVKGCPSAGAAVGGVSEFSMATGGESGMSDGGELYMSTREAAAFLRLSPRTLDRYRVSGDGPEFHKFGNRVRYARPDVEAWAAARRRRSTSDDGQGARRAA